MRRRLAIALILAALIICVTGCHVHVTVHALAVPHAPAARR